MAGPEVGASRLEEPASSSSSQPQAAREVLKHIEAYTNRACIGNPGSGGYALVLRYGAYRRELSGGYRKTTNNRMELVAAIRALKALKERCHVTLYSDSQYLVRMMQGGWPRKWRANGWWRSTVDRARCSARRYATGRIHSAVWHVTGPGAA